MIIHQPKIRFESEAGDSSPIEATIQGDGRLRVQSDPDSGHLNAAWMTTTETREFALELLGLADAADAIHAE